MDRRPTTERRWKLNTRCPTTKCARRTPTGWTICAPCAHTLKRHLAETPALADYLDDTLARRTGHGARNGARTTETAVVFDQRAREAIYVLRTTLTAWIRELTRASTAAQNPTTPAMARWLYARHHQLVTHPAAHEMLEELRAATELGWAAVDNPPERMFLGSCTCGQDLHVQIGRIRATCRECGTEHDVANLRAQLVAALDDRLVTAAEFALLAAAHITPGTSRAHLRARVNTWADRGLVTRHTTEQGESRYRFADLLLCLATRPPTRRPEAKRCAP